MKILLPLFYICFTLNSYAQMPTYIPANGLVGWWPFSGNANDESVNNNNGIVNGATLTTDRNGQINSAYSFNGSSSYISILDDAALRPPIMTISALIKLNDLSQINMPIFYKGMYEVFELDARYFAIKQNSGCLSYNGAGWLGLSFETYPYALNTWYNVVGVFDGVNISFYINGVLIVQYTASNSFIDNCAGGEDFRIGRRHNLTGSYFNGKMDEIAIWNRALSICEIKKIHQLGSPIVTATSNLSSVCEGSDITLSSSGSNTYLWTPGNISGNNVVVNVTSSTNFLVTATDLDGCIDTSSVYVNVNPLPMVTSTITDSIFCIGENVATLTANPSIGTWTGTGVSSGNFNPNIAGVGSHILNYSFTDGNNCTNSVNQEMIVSQPTIIISSPTTVFCDYNIHVALTSSPIGGTWSGTGVVGNTFSPQIAGVGNYYITYEYTDANGCSNSDSLFMEVGACLGLNENTNENISIHPNPTHSTFTISGIDQSEISSIEILDITGKLLFKTNSHINIDLSNYENGVYLFRIIGEKNCTGRIVKE